ncbi:unnamed protein product [Oncorhynchus mykiss]|uniref:PseI/NeuA/B-like domain-containing protein n=1 Tax=Oncorhynchus mykiss TaxID=8022 RepID=A0A060W0Y7_ONCMY|nr:unnamed protein product [Oncorhynchus mykiss]
MLASIYRTAGQTASSFRRVSLSTSSTSVPWSGMDEVAVDFLDELEVPFFKVASCDANSFPYLELTAKKVKYTVYK